MSEPEDADRTIALTRPRQPRAVSESEQLHPYLVVVEGDGPGRRLLLNNSTITVGRDPARELVLSDADVSRLHLRVILAGDSVIVEDQNSTNGTFIDGQRLTGATVLEDGHLLQLGMHVLKLERRTKADVQRTEELDRDLEKASAYVRSLLPARVTDGPIRTDWYYLPSAQLGGDVFGCDWLDADTFIAYLIDVSGHGVGAAMHSVSALNVLRQRALPDTDMRDPAAVMGGLNDMFQMDSHNGMFFTMWYGVYDTRTRTLRYSCGGHHAAYLVPHDRNESTPLKTAGLMVGAAPDVPFRTASATVPAGAALYLFSDGVFEVVTKEQTQWRLQDFLPVMMAAPAAGESDAERIYRTVKTAARSGPLDDDFSILIVTFA